MGLLDDTAVELGKKIKSGEVTVKEAVTACLDQIEKAESTIHAYVTIDREGALKKAEDEDADVFFNGKTNYEIRIRLISSDGYICYYVGLLDKTKSVDFLLDGETGEILAKKK